MERAGRLSVDYAGVVKDLRLRRVSDETTELFGSLRDLCANGGWGQEGEKIELLEQIGNEGEPGAIPPLMCFAFVRNQRVRERARAVIQRLFAGVPWEGCR